MYIKITRWECRRLVDILRTRGVKESHNAWADNLADLIERELVRQDNKEKENA